MKGINGEGARRGMKGCGSVLLGGIARGSTSTLVVTKNEYFANLIGEPRDLFIAAYITCNFQLKELYKRIYF